MSDELCKQHSEDLKELKKMVQKILDVLKGPIDGPGYFEKTEKRLSSLERFRNAFVKTFLWIITCFGGGSILTIIGILITKHFGE